MIKNNKTKLNEIEQKYGKEVMKQEFKKITKKKKLDKSKYIKSL